MVCRGRYFDAISVIIAEYFENSGYTMEMLSYNFRDVWFTVLLVFFGKEIRLKERFIILGDSN